MAVSRPFAYNTGSTISGTVQVGTLAVGIPSVGYGATGLQWWQGPDENLGYVIAYSQPNGLHPNPISIPAYLGFKRSTLLTENSFISLANYVANGATSPFTSGNEASTWLTNNGYWNSWVFITPTPTITPTITPTNTITPTKTPTPTPTPIITYSYKRSITIDYTKCGTANSTDFPVLVSFTDATFKTVANGGNVQNSNGYDIAFYSDSGLTTSLFWEIELYVPTTGECIFWVKVPTLSSSVNTVIYIAYGKSGITTFQSTSTSVWNANYKMVYHIKDGTTLNLTESTSNGNNFTNFGATATTGKIDGGANLVRTSLQKITTTSNFVIPTTGTASFWAKCTVAPDGTVGNTQPFITHRITNPIRAFDFYINKGIGGFGWYNNGVDDRIFVNLIGTILANVWYYYTLTWTNGGTTELRINDVQTGTPTTGLNTTYSTGTSPTSIGWDALSGGIPVNFYFSGQIDEIRFSNVVRPSSWITSEYNNQNSPSTFFTLGPQT